MRSSYSKQSNLKITIYAICAAVVIGVCIVVLQDIKIPSEHVVQSIKIDLED